MRNTNPADEVPAARSEPAPPPDDREHEHTEEVGSAPALQRRDSGGGDIPS